MALGFEEKLKRIEEIVRELEDGDLPLEECVKLYEEGMNLIKECKETLERVKQRVVFLSTERMEG